MQDFPNPGHLATIIPAADLSGRLLKLEAAREPDPPRPVETQAARPAGAHDEDQARATPTSLREITVDARLLRRLNVAVREAVGALADVRRQYGYYRTSGSESSYTFGTPEYGDSG